MRSCQVITAWPGVEGANPDQVRYYSLLGVAEKNLLCTPFRRRSTKLHFGNCSFLMTLFQFVVVRPFPSLSGKFWHPKRVTEKHAGVFFRFILDSYDFFHGN